MKKIATTTTKIKETNNKIKINNSKSENPIF